MTFLRPPNDYCLDSPRYTVKSLIYILNNQSIKKPCQHSRQIGLGVRKGVILLNDPTSRRIRSGFASYGFRGTTLAQEYIGAETSRFRFDS